MPADRNAHAAKSSDGGERILVGRVVAEEDGTPTSEGLPTHERPNGFALVEASRLHFDDRFAAEQPKLGRERCDAVAKLRLKLCAAIGSAAIVECEGVAFVLDSNLRLVRYGGEETAFEFARQKLRALFDNGNGALFPNQFVNTRLLVNTLQGVTLVPTGAIQHNGQATFLYVITNGVASERTITTGTADGGVTAVKGVNPGEIVATSSFEKLQNGSKVTVVKQAPPANSSQGNTP